MTRLSLAIGATLLGGCSTMLDLEYQAPQVILPPQPAATDPASEQPEEEEDQDWAPTQIEPREVSWEEPEAPREAPDLRDQRGPRMLPPEVAPEVPLGPLELPGEPVGVVREADPIQLALRGGDGGTQHFVNCPEGQALVGVEGFEHNGEEAIDRLRLVCGALSPEPGLRVLALSVEEGERSPWFGRSNSDNRFLALCPEGEVVVGFEGHSSRLMKSLTLHCGPPLAIEDDADWIVDVEEADAIDPVGYPEAGAAPFPVTDCPPGYIATGSRLRSGEHVDAFTLLCSAHTVAFE